MEEDTITCELCRGYMGLFKGYAGLPRGFMRFSEDRGYMGFSKGVRLRVFPKGFG